MMHDLVSSSERPEKLVRMSYCEVLWKAERSNLAKMCCRTKEGLWEEEFSRYPVFSATNATVHRVI